MDEIYAQALNRLKKAVLNTNRRQRFMIAQLLQVSFIVFVSFFAGLTVANLFRGSWLLLLLFAPAFVLIMRVDFETRELPLSRKRNHKKNRYSDKAELTIRGAEKESKSAASSSRSIAPGSAASVDKIDRDAWRNDVEAPQVEKAWALFAGHIVQEFIYDSWYSSLTPDTEFPASIRALLNAEFGRLAKRAKKLNLMLLMSQALDIIVEQIEIFRDTKDELRHGDTRWRMEEASDELNEKMIRMQLKRDCNLHPSMRTTDGHYKVLKQLAEVAVAHLDPPVSGDKVLSRVVSRELLAGSVFRKLIQLCTCYNVQTWLVMLLDRKVEDGKGQDESRPSDEMRGVWEQEQKIEHFSQAEATLERLTHESGSYGGSGSVDAGVPELHVIDVVHGHASKRAMEGITTGIEAPPGPSSEQASNINTASIKSKFRGQPIATVVAAEIVNSTGSFQRDFVVYSIRVGDDRGEWTVSRRYRHFEQLHRALRSLNLDGFDAELPSKRFFFRDFTPQYVEARRVALNDYLQVILRNPALYSSEFAWEFLKKRSERFQVTKNGDSVSSMVKHHLGNVVSVTIDATRLGQTVGKGVGKGMSRVGNTVYQHTKERTKGARDYLFSAGSSANLKDPQSGLKKLASGSNSDSTASSPSQHDMLATELQLMEDEINLGMPGQRMSPAYFSAEHDAAVSMEADGELDVEIDDDEDILGLLLHPAESVAGSLYDFIDCIFLLQDRGFFRRQMFALYRRLVRLLFGSGIDEVAGTYIADIRQPATVAKLIGKLQSFLWPGGKFVKGDGHREEVTAERYLEPLPPPPEDYERVKKRLRNTLQDGPTSALSKLVGRIAFYSGVDDLCSILSCQTMVTQISYGLMELILEHLFERNDMNDDM